MSATNGHVLGDVASFVRGITFTPEDVKPPFEKGTAVCMRTKNVQFDLDEEDLIAVPKDFVRRKEQYLTEGDLLVSSANSWNLVGKCCWVPKLDYEATAGGFISILRADRTKADPRYLYHWFAAPKTQHKVRLCGRQTTNISNLNYERCLGIPIPLPKLEEQKRIATILDKADTIRRKRLEAIQELTNLPAALFSKLFGDPISNSRSFPTAELRELVSLIGGFAFRSEDYQIEGIPLIRIGNANNSRFTEDALVYLPIDYAREFERYILYPGDMIMTLTGTVGKDDYANIVEVPDNYDRWFLNQRVAKVTLSDDRLNKAYLIQLLMTPQVKNLIRRMDRGVRQANLRNEDILSQRVPVPPKNLQEKFASGLSQFQRLRQNMILQHETSDSLFNSLVQRAFKGEL